MDEMKAISESDNEVVADLRQIVGVENTAKIIKQCGGAFLYIPQMRTVLKTERDKAIYADFNAGSSFKQIALKYGISELTAVILFRKKGNQKNDWPIRWT